MGGGASGLEAKYFDNHRGHNIDPMAEVEYYGFNGTGSASSVPQQSPHQYLTALGHVGFPFFLAMV